MGLTAKVPADVPSGAYAHAHFPFPRTISVERKLRITARGLHSCRCHPGVPSNKKSSARTSKGMFNEPYQGCFIDEVILPPKGGYLDVSDTLELKFGVVERHVMHSPRQTFLLIGASR